MDQYFDALQKSHTREGILGSVSETKEEFLEKGKKAQIGEIRTWKGVKFQKQPNGGWTPVPNKVEHDYSTAKEISGHPVGKDSYSTKLSQYKDGSEIEEKETFEGNLPTDVKGLIYEPKDSTREKVEVKKTGDSFAVSFVGNNGKRRLVSLMDETSTRKFLSDYTLDIDKNTPPIEKKGHYQEFVDADTGEVVKKWVEDKPEELSAEEEIADIERQCINAKEGITGGAAGTKTINEFRVDFDLDFSDKTISIHIKDAENKPVVAKDFEYDNSEYTKEEAIENALSLIKEKTSIEKEPEFDYHFYEERENEIRKEYGPIQDELRDAKSDYDNKLQERRELQMEMEQEVGALYIKGDDEAAETLAQEYGEKFNQIDDEISELTNKISELEPKVREMEDKIDEIWLH